MRQAASSPAAIEIPRGFSGLGRPAALRRPARTATVGATTKPADAFPDDLLCRYLAAHDATCPTCGYNLRGVETTRCPECGRSITLGLHEGGALRRQRGLLLLVLAWLLVAGSINAVRTGQEIHTAARAMQFFTLTMNSAGAPTAIIDPMDVATVTIVGPNASLRADRSLFDDQLMPITSRLTRSPTFGGLSWSAVSPRQWTRLGGWTALGVTALVGLVLLAVNWRRPASRRAARTLTTIAWLGFAGYFAYHVGVFAMDVV